MAPTAPRSRTAGPTSSRKSAANCRSTNAGSPRGRIIPLPGERPRQLASRILKSSWRSGKSAGGRESARAPSTLYCVLCTGLLGGVVLSAVHLLILRAQAAVLVLVVLDFLPHHVELGLLVGRRRHRALLQVALHPQDLL